MIYALTIAGCTSNYFITGPSPTLAVVPVESAGQTNPRMPQATAAGAAVYKTNCASCHGDRGYGDGPAGQALTPRPVNLVELGNVSSNDYLFSRIGEGKSGTAMVAWKSVLTNEQIKQVIAYIRTLK